MRINFPVTEENIRWLEDQANTVQDAEEETPRGKLSHSEWQAIWAKLPLIGCERDDEDSASAQARELVHIISFPVCFSVQL